LEGQVGVPPKKQMVVRVVAQKKKTKMSPGGKTVSFQKKSLRVKNKKPKKKKNKLLTK
jgi:hypothetical protein